MAGRRLRHDDGFTLAELVVTIALMGIVIAGSYSLIHVAGVVSAQSDRRAWIANEIGAPLDAAERMFTQQAPPMEQAGRYICEIRTDQDRDNNYEFHRFEATTEGELTETFYEQIDSPVAEVRTWSVANANRSAGVPMFTYYAIDGTDISAETATFIRRYATAVEVVIVTEHDGEQMSDSRRIFFRNR